MKYEEIINVFIVMDYLLGLFFFCVCVWDAGQVGSPTVVSSTSNQLDLLFYVSKQIVTC
jgi:hypothetical protein